MPYPPCVRPSACGPTTPVRITRSASCSAPKAILKAARLRSRRAPALRPGKKPASPICSITAKPHCPPPGNRTLTSGHERAVDVRVNEHYHRDQKQHQREPILNQRALQPRQHRVRSLNSVVAETPAAAARFVLVRRQESQNPG